MNILENNGKYYFYNALKIVNKLEPKQYLFNFDDFGNCWLEDIENFKLPEKIYEVNQNLRQSIIKSFASYGKNLGVLLTGNKGQGKSLTAKLICRDMNLPTIVVNKQIPQSINFVTFFNNIKQDFVLFVDEFEKLFKQKGGEDDKATSYHKQETFLSFMDGVLTNDHKTLFLLTTNEQVNEFFINRPSRIKFLVEYDELPEELFNLITNDRLINKDYREDLEDNVSLINLNIDLLISIIEDINLFDKPFSAFKDIYNYKFEQYRYEIYHIVDKVEKWNSMFTSARRFKAKDRYIANHDVNTLIKFNKDEIIFETTIWEEDKDGKGRDKDIVVKIVPSKSFSMHHNHKFVL